MAKVLEERPDAALANLTYGQILFSEGNDDAALGHLKAAQAADPRLPNLHNRIGAVYLRKGLFAEAEAAFRRALEIDGDSAAAHDGLGVVFYNLSRHEEALEQFMLSVSLLHYQPQAHYHLGLAARALGYVDWAIQAFTTASQLRPGFVAAHARLVELYEALGDTEQADQHRTLAGEVIEKRSPRQGARPRIKLEIEPRRAITVVSGLPRSGTSLMMQMLFAGGMEILTDGERQADADNPRGYYELEAVKRLRESPDGLADAEGKAVKVVSMLLTTLPSDKG